MKDRTRVHAYIQVCFVNVLWGLSFIASKRALSGGFEPFTLAAVRFVISAILLLPVLARKEGLRLPKKDVLPLLVSALLGMTIYFLFEYKGLERTSASTASLIIAAVPAFTLLYGALVKRLKYPPVAYAGVAFSLVGVYLIVSNGRADGGDTLQGNLLILGACLCWVAYIEVTDKILKRRSSLSVTTWQCVFGAATLLPCTLFERVDLAQIDAVSWLMALYLAVMCSVIGYLLYVRVIHTLEPFKTSLFINLNPLAAVLGGVLLLGETLAPMQLLGGAVVLLSIFLVNRNR